VTDWRAIIAHLERHRVRHIDIGAHVGRSEGWVGLLKRGTIRQPLYDQGVMLIALAREYGYFERKTYDPQVRVEESA
jgi:hypothetical protein